MFFAFRPFGFAKFQQVIGVGQPLLHGQELLVGQHDKLFLAVLDQNFGMQSQHNLHQ